MNIYSEYRPWGSFEQYCQNEKCTVKLIKVEPNSELSLQYHNHRSEFWKIIGGEALIVIDDKTIHGKKGDEFFIPVGTKHRIKTQPNFKTEIMEISFGDFDEDDIVRIEDKYKRV